jgi:uncharacterized protein YlxW (UPF0749 family)
MTTQKIIVIISVVMGVAGVLGGAIALDRKYDESPELTVLQGEVELVKERLDVKILQDRIDGAQNRIWALQDRFRGQTMPQEVQEEIRRLKRDIDSWKRQLNKRS